MPRTRVCRDWKSQHELVATEHLPSSPAQNSGSFAWIFRSFACLVTVYHTLFLTCTVQEGAWRMMAHGALLRIDRAISLPATAQGLIQRPPYGAPTESTLIHRQALDLLSAVASFGARASDLSSLAWRGYTVTCRAETGHGQRVMNFG